MRGWLFPGQNIDVGTVGDTDVLVADAPITAVSYSNPAAPTITTGTAIATTTGTHYVYIPNPNSASAPNPELNGLRQIIGSGALGGLNPATAGQEFWRGAFNDTTTTVFSLDLPLNLQRYVLQNSNEPGTAVWTGYRSRPRLLQPAPVPDHIRQRQNLAAGASSPKWNGITSTRSPTCSIATGSS